MVQFDDILQYLGAFGRYQVRTYLLVCLLAIAPALHMFSQVFLVAETDYWCYVSGVEDYEQQYCGDGVSDDVCEDTWKNFTIPYEVEDGICGTTYEYSQCYRYNTTGVGYYPGIDPNLNGYETMECNEGYQYDRSVYKSTAFTEFDLVCDQYYLGALSSTIYMVGILFGALFFGALSDWIGRLKSLMVSVVILVVFGTAVAFSPNYITFCIFRFGVGFSANGMFLIAFVLATEFVGPSRRTVAGISIEFFFCFGYMLMSVYAYFIREWWKLQLVITVPNVIFLCYYFVVPESPRWLIVNNKIDEAEKIIRKCAKVNKVVVPEELLTELREEKKKEKSLKEDEEPVKTYGALELFRLPNMRAKSLNLFYNWFTNSFVYYGLSLNTSNLGSNDFLSAFVSAAVEIPAYAMSIFILDSRLGRRWSLCLTMVIGGIACISTVFVPACDSSLEWVGVTLSMIGKFAISASFAIVYIYTAELYPTSIRNVGMGLCSMSARIGGMLAPQMILIGSIWEPLPLIVFGATSVVAGLLAILLPETYNKKLPETLEEGENFGKKVKKNKALEVTEKYTEKPDLYNSIDVQVDMDTPDGVVNNGFTDIPLEKIST